MDSDGVGKIRQKRGQQGSKPYQRNPSLLKRFSSSVRDLLMPSWLGGGSGDKKDETKQIPSSSKSVTDTNESYGSESHSSTALGTSEARFGGVSKTAVQTSSQMFNPVITSDSTHHKSNPMATASGQHKSWLSQPPSSSVQNSLTREESAQLRMSDSYLNDRNNTAVESVPVRQITVSTGSFNKSTPASKKQKLWSPEIARQGKPLAPPTTEKPAFNSTLFGSLDKSDTSFFGDSFRESSFYSGRTRYGGAAAERKQSMNKSLPYQASLPLRKQVKANEMNKSFQAVTSVTAQRIMDTLDRMSTPLGDAKKIPTADTSNDSILSFTPSSYRRTSLLGTSRSATRPLQLPKGPPTNRYQMVGRAEAATNRYRPSETERKDSSVKSASTSFISQEPVNIQVKSVKSSAPSDNSAVASGKMKTKKFSNHISSKVEEVEALEVPNLRTDFTLPVSSMKPITLSGFPSKTNSDAQPSIPSSSLLTEASPLKFTFSTPIQKTQASINSITPQDKDYTFSTPIQAAKTSAAGAEEGSKLSPEPAVGASSAAGHAASPAFSSTTTPVWGSTSARPKPKAASPDIGGTSSSFSSYSKWGTKENNEVSAASESPSGFMSVSSSLKKGSVMDILGGSMKTSTSSPVAPPKNDDLLAQFKKPTGAWECDTCMLRNNADKNKCVACEAPKPGAKKAEVPVPAAKSSPTIPISGDLLAKFKQPSGAWECDTCMLNNKSEVSKCVACEAPRPGGKVSQQAPQAAKSLNNNSLTSMFKAPSGNWECDTCMIQNADTALKCVACESSKPGLQSTGVVSKPLSNGPEVSAVKINPGGGFSFDLPSATTTTSEGSGGFKFGNTVAKTSAPSAPATGFVFGGSSEAPKDKTSSESSSGGFTFGSSASKAEISPSSVNKTPQPSGGFVFGAVSNSSPSTKDIKVSTGFQISTVVPQVSVNSVKPASSKPVETGSSEKSNTSAFQFGSGSDSDSKSLNGGSIAAKPAFGSNQQAPPSFSFSAQQSKPPTTTSNTSSFNFSQPPSTSAVSQPIAKPTSGLFAFGGSAPVGSPASSAGLGMGNSLTDLSKPAAPVVNGGFGSTLDQKSGSKVTDGLKSGFNGSAAAPVFGFGQSAQPSSAASSGPISSNKRSVDFSNADHSPAKKTGRGQPVANGLFAFGGPSPPAYSANAASTGGFGGFGAAASAGGQPAPAPAGGFAFGGSAAGFGQTPVAQPAAPPAFGANSAQPGGFNFAMSSTPSFNFGSTSQPAAPTQGGVTPFQFGGNKNDNAAPASTPGMFQFNAAPSMAPAPAFGGAAATPGMGGGFSIGSTGESAGRRPMKKAIRKIKR